MTGNAWQWCLDIYQEQLSETIDPLITGGMGSIRVIRGGSWSSDAETCRSAKRGWVGPSFRGVKIGFRLALHSFRGKCQ